MDNPEPPLLFQMTLISVARQLWCQLSLARSRHSEVKAGCFYPTPPSFLTCFLHCVPRLQHGHVGPHAVTSELSTARGDGITSRERFSWSVLLCPSFRASMTRLQPCLPHLILAQALAALLQDSSRGSWPYSHTVVATAPFSHRATGLTAMLSPCSSTCHLRWPWPLHFRHLLLLHGPWLCRPCPSLPVPLLPGLCLKVTMSGSPPQPSPHTDMLTSLPSFPAHLPPQAVHWLCLYPASKLPLGLGRALVLRPGSLLLPCSHTPASGKGPWVSYGSSGNHVPRPGQSTL